MDPLDAGTDNGFTFTAPNWPTEPQGVVYRITSTHPQHPAGSFYYPSLKRLPPIATFQFIKVSSDTMVALQCAHGRRNSSSDCRFQTHQCLTVASCPRAPGATSAASTWWSHGDRKATG